LYDITGTHDRHCGADTRAAHTKWRQPIGGRVRVGKSGEKKIKQRNKNKINNVQRRRRRRRVSPVRSGARLSFVAGPAQASAVVTSSDKKEKEKKQKNKPIGQRKTGEKSNIYSQGDPAEQTVRHSTQCVHVGRVAPTTPPTEHRPNIKTSSRAHAPCARATVPTRLQWCQRFIAADAVNRRTTYYYYVCVMYIQYCVYTHYADKNQNITLYRTYFV